MFQFGLLEQWQFFYLVFSLLCSRLIAWLKLLLSGSVVAEMTTSAQVGSKCGRLWGYEVFLVSFIYVP